VRLEAQSSNQPGGGGDDRGDGAGMTTVSSERETARREWRLGTPTPRAAVVAASAKPVARTEHVATRDIGTSCLRRRPTNGSLWRRVADQGVQFGAASVGELLQLKP